MVVIFICLLSGRLVESASTPASAAGPLYGLAGIGHLQDNHLGLGDKGAVHFAGRPARIEAGLKPHIKRLVVEPAGNDENLLRIGVAPGAKGLGRISGLEPGEPCVVACLPVLGDGELVEVAVRAGDLLPLPPAFFGKRVPICSGGFHSLVLPCRRRGSGRRNQAVMIPARAFNSRSSPFLAIRRERSRWPPSGRYSRNRTRNWLSILVSDAIVLGGWWWWGYVGFHFVLPDLPAIFLASLMF